MHASLDRIEDMIGQDRGHDRPGRGGDRLLVEKFLREKDG
jgi:hypothetical protein